VVRFAQVQLDDYSHYFVSLSGMRNARTQPEAPRRRTGGRSARVVQAVLDATIEALAHAGYQALSFEDVAERAGVSRTTIYRRWPAKQDLVRAALLRFAEERSALFPDTGSLRGDLLAGVADCGSCEGEQDLRLLRALAAEFEDPELSALARLAWDRIHQPNVTIIERAIARGELPPGSDPAFIIDPVMFTVMMRRLLFGDETSPADAERLVDVVLAGARTGAGVRRQR
jgi:AcrR family transcriptional regulator